MPFTLLVCGDLFSEKVNLELPFPEKPTLPELKNHVQSSFTAEMRCLQPPNMPAIEQFNVNRIQVYDDAHLKWVDLSSPQQLHEYDQLYCFQPVSSWQSDVQQDLPAPRPPTQPVRFSDVEPFMLFVSGDLISEKVTLELWFRKKPTLSELKEQVVTVTAEMRSQQPQNNREFDMDKTSMMVYDDAHQKWRDLSSPEQLHEYGMVCFCQPGSEPWCDGNMSPQSLPTQPEAFSLGGDNSVAGPCAMAPSQAVATIPFTLFVCADLVSSAENVNPELRSLVHLELPFPEKPTLPEMLDHVQHCFTLEIRSEQPNHEQFNMDKISMLVYDNAHQKWVDLCCPQQLCNLGQVCFCQPGSKPWWKGLSVPCLRPMAPPSKGDYAGPFTLLVGADLSEKVNLKLMFPEMPTLVEFKRRAEIALTAEVLCLRPEVDPSLIEPFHAERVQILDEMENRWTDLSSPEQLHEYAQLYCYQPVSSWPIDSDQKMPLPRPPLAVPWQCGGDVVTQPPMNNVAAPVQPIVQPQEHKAQKSSKLKGSWFRFFRRNKREPAKPEYLQPVRNTTCIGGF